ncbi:hypothetical protein ACJMK2_009946 [Sinanodonta woodiana]|uniref:Kazal-like domain-containing protein n=1 Tax=Sinanodonta woodiana TaxID=1069815 RepID=A0ABD3VG70_SINWO
MLKLICATILLLFVAVSTDAHQRNDLDDVMRHPHYHHRGYHAHGQHQTLPRGRVQMSWYHRAMGRGYGQQQSSLDERQQVGCPMMCPMNYNPVCGTDRNTYSNNCELRLAACTRRMRIDVLKQGPC